MATCPACSAALASESRFCPACGSPLSASSDDVETRLSPQAAPKRQARASSSSKPSSGSHSGWLSTTAIVDEGRFVPGAILAERYRIIGPLGRGGMGEVYRADDLRLGQPVALKSA